jgi:ketosteroid isomerase-like protein
MKPMDCPGTKPHYEVISALKPSTGALNIMQSPTALIRSLFIVACCLWVQIIPSSIQAAETDKAAVIQIVNSYHEALKAGDKKGAVRLLAPDAVILENGGVETREEYISHHLEGDIEFSQAVTTRRSAIQVTVLGDVAWTSSSSESQGTFHQRAVNASGAELMVLTKTANGWVIKAIHWSSRMRS